MKDPRHGPINLSGTHLTPDATAPSQAVDARSFEDVHRDHARFVWLTLQRMGVRQDDLEDTFQDTFIVVHRKLHTFDGSSHMRTWLYGICLRVASDYRRKAHRRREELSNEVPERTSQPPDSPEDWVAKRQAREQLEAILDSMPLEKRAVFVMFEIDGLPCSEIAGIVGVPVGTVYSRIHAARQAFVRAVERFRAGGER